jgi:hypothetical protein
LLEPNPRGYLVVCLSDNDDVADQFELEVLSSAVLEVKPSVSILENMGFKQTIKGQWSGESSGGNITERSFTKNPFYVVRSTQPDTQLFIQLSTPVQAPVGIYVFKSPRGQLSELTQGDIDKGVSTSLFVIQENSLYYDCGKTPGQFLVVPCTYNKADGAFALNISASKAIEIGAGEQKAYAIRKDYQLSIANIAEYQRRASARYQM